MNSFHFHRRVIVFSVMNRWFYPASDSSSPVGSGPLNLLDSAPQNPIHQTNLTSYLWLLGFDNKNEYETKWHDREMMFSYWFSHSVRILSFMNVSNTGMWRLGGNTATRFALFPHLPIAKIISQNRIFKFK